MNTAVAELMQPQQAPVRVSLIARLAARFHVDPDKMLSTLKQTAFRQKGSDPEVTTEQLMALCVVADQYGLNPWTKEIYAFPDKHNGIVPVVGLDGWSRIVNNHEQYDGVEFDYGPASSKHKGAPEWIECKIWRKDRSHPTVVREILAECYRSTGPWDSHPSRMLRHKSFMQCGRIAFSFVGIYDEDEAQRIIEGEASRVSETSTAVQEINRQVGGGATAITDQTGERELPAQAIEGEKVAEGSGAEVSGSEPEKVAATQSAAAATAGPVKYADVATKINAAKSVDDLTVARDLIRSMPDAKDRRALNDECAVREKALKVDDGK